MPGVTINFGDILFKPGRSVVFNLPARIYFARGFDAPAARKPFGEVEQ